MVYGPIAAILVELFQAHPLHLDVLPYHIGNAGWRVLPTTPSLWSPPTGNIYSGLWYPVVVAGATVVIGSFAAGNS